jgi:hypothetical protein
MRTNEMPIRSRAAANERGQILVIVAVGMLAIIAMVGVVIDGGFAWGQQRDTQNAADAASEAGALRLAENLPYQHATPPVTAPNGNAEVRASVLAAATTYEVTVEEAWYTDWFGNRIGGAPLIGPSQLPGGAAPSSAEGVEVTTTKTFDTFIAQIVGIDEMTARTDAIAHAGYIDTIGEGNVMPVTLPLNVTTCTNTNRPDTDGSQWPLGTLQVFPLCSSGPGNVGWLDWTPPGGGVSELAEAIRHPNNPQMTIPGWFYIDQSGNPSSPSQITAALDTYVDGDTEVIIPLFDATCEDQPPNQEADACETGPGNGQQQWYHLGGWIALDLEWIDLNGGRSACGSGNGSTGCFAGYLRSITYSGTIRRAGANESSLSLTGINLIQ